MRVFLKCVYWLASDCRLTLVIQFGKQTLRAFATCFRASRKTTGLVSARIRRIPSRTRASAPSTSILTNLGRERWPPPLPDRRWRRCQWQIPSLQGCRSVIPELRSTGSPPNGGLTTYSPFEMRGTKRTGSRSEMTGWPLSMRMHWSCWESGGPTGTIMRPPSRS